MDLIRLRTMTRKSRVGYGKYKDKTVGELIDAGMTKVLEWMYFNVQWCNFTPEVLEELRITGGWVIDKPGTDKEAFNKRRMSRLAYKVGWDKANLIRYWREKKKAQKIEAEHSKEISKARLQAMNHGHIHRI